MTRPRLVALALAVALTATLSGCFAPGPQPTDGPDPVETEAPAEAGLGVPIRVEQSEGVGELTVHTAYYGEFLPDDPLEFEAQNGGYLYLTVTWTGLEGTTQAFILNWGATDAAGVEGGAYVLLENPINELAVEAGTSVDGEIAFDIGAGPWEFVVFDDRQQEAARFTIDPADLTS